jgi:hypothetical protein
MLIVAMATPLLSGCYGKGSSADPPANFTPAAGDGRVMLTWTPVAGVDFWLFTATDPSLTAFNWTGLAHAYARINAPTPFYMCGLIDGLPYYFAANGRINGGPGGPSSPTITATPYNASAAAWTPASGVPSTTNLYGIGYTSLTTCGNIATISATGSFAAVGTDGVNGTIYTSSDGKSWNAPASVPSGLPNLYAVTGYAAYQNNVLSPGLRWVAVGAGGASVYSTDGITWAVGNTASANPNNYDLRSITQVAGTFYAVGDAGTIISSIDGIIWTHRPYNAANATTQPLNGVTHGAIYVAVGDSGTILTSGDGNTWTAQTSGTTSNLRQVTSFLSIYGSIYVAVGDGGTIVTSKDGATWTTRILPGGTQNLVGITVESRAVDPATALADIWLGFISTAQFVAIDSAGNAYTSVNGYTWSAATPTGSTSLNALVSSGFGYVAAGNAGATAYAF